MLRIILKQFLFVVINSAIVISQTIVHQIDDLGGKYEASSPQTLTDQLIAAAKQYQEYSPIPRIAVYDMAFGADSTEFNNLNTYGIVVVSAVCQNKGDHPIKLYYEFKDKRKLELKLLFSNKIVESNKEIIKVFGANRVDYYYLIPYYITKTKGKLLMDWNNNRDDFSLDEFPTDNSLKFVKNDKLQPKEIDIDKSIINNFIKREFNVYLNKD